MLDMRFDQAQKLSAYDIVNQYSSSELQKIFIEYADFTPVKSKEIAEHIVQTRKKSDIQTTFDLKKIL
jgi:16S rRNA (cytosine1402-N4)-methyltransferase